MGESEAIMNSTSVEQILSAIAAEYVDNTYDVLSTVRGILE